jgi:hypothetical protein
MSRAFKSLLSAMILTSSLAALPARADAAATRVYVRIQPPVRVVEVRTHRPGYGYVWTDGYHRWNGHAYAWRHGRWVRPPRAHAHWVPAHWVHSRHGWYMVQGHWRY